MQLRSEFQDAGAVFQGGRAVIGDIAARGGDDADAAVDAVMPVMRVAVNPGGGLKRCEFGQQVGGVSGGDGADAGAEIGGIRGVVGDDEVLRAGVGLAQGG